MAKRKTLEEFSAELDRCPFCNGPAEVFKTEIGMYGVKCTSDNFMCCGGLQSWFSNAADAVAAWNRRKYKPTKTRTRKTND